MDRSVLRWGQVQQEPLGDVAALPDNQRFDEAKRQAQEWFKHLNLGGSTARETVQEACAAYAAYAATIYVGDDARSSTWRLEFVAGRPIEVTQIG